ncbi:glycosyltransferase family 2 protein [Chryseobacterium soli]|uniref:glycosyltransferase family 2 protein n=1 Tax=Chryseobacterium soli TaxID=445961 RepID=UPI0029541710|nr:glycosyltransferase family A protein [Chryseobacterium soli]MDV7697274.1 glycosyltransferase family 2 protein [Chryseobacterium soli]
MNISVIIPMYNSEKTITETLKSVFSQTCKPDEIIIVNDGSKDDSKNIVDQIINNNQSGIKIQIINIKNSGVSVARNTGIKNAHGDWIALLDSDDSWEVNKLERQIEIIKENPSIDFLGTTRNKEVIKNILWIKLGHLTKITAKQLLLRFVFVTPTILFRKSIVDDIGYFDENQRYAEEGNYFIRIANKYNAYLLNESLVITGGGKAHFGESGLSGNILEMEKGELKNIKDSLHMGIINSFEYVLISTFSILKYVRRFLIVKLK